jgi:hypothetical protein
MKNIAIVICLSGFSSLSFSSENCPGTVTGVLDYPGHCEGHVAFNWIGQAQLFW